MVAGLKAPVLLGNGPLYVPTYSGSNNRLYAVDSKSCRVLWRSRVFSGPTSFHAGHLTVGDRRLPLDRSCRPAAAAKGD